MNLHLMSQKLTAMKTTKSKLQITKFLVSYCFIGLCCCSGPLPSVFFFILLTLTTRLRANVEGVTLLNNCRTSVTVSSFGWYASEEAVPAWSPAAESELSRTIYNCIYENGAKHFDQNHPYFTLISHNFQAASKFNHVNGQKIEKGRQCKGDKRVKNFPAQ